MHNKHPLRHVVYPVAAASAPPVPSVVVDPIVAARPEGESNYRHILTDISRVAWSLPLIDAEPLLLP